MTQLKRGDIAQLHSLVVHPEFNGMQCIVRDGPYLGYFYIDIPGFEGQWDYAHQRNLKPVRPPEADNAAAHRAMLDCIERAKQPSGVPA